MLEGGRQVDDLAVSGKGTRVWSCDDSGNITIIGGGLVSLKDRPVLVMRPYYPQRGLELLGEHK